MRPPWPYAVSTGPAPNRPRAPDEGGLDRGNPLGRPPRSLLPGGKVGESRRGASETLAALGPHNPGRAIRTCGRDDRLSDAARIMRENDCGCLLVVTRSDPEVAAGILTDRDICMAALEQGKRLDELRVGDAMSTEVDGFDFSEARALAETTGLHGEARTLALLDQRGEVLAFLTLFASGGGGGRWRCLT